MGTAMEKYQSCILHCWKQVTANSPSADPFLKQRLRNTLQLSVVAHREWFVLTHFRWPEPELAMRQQNCIQSISSDFSFPFLPKCSRSCLSCWRRLLPALMLGSTPGAGQILCNRAEHLKPQEAGARTVLPPSTLAELGAWKSQPWIKAPLGNVSLLWNK